MQNVDFKGLFKKLSKPVECGTIIDGVRYQKSKGEWSSERIFILSNEICKENPEVFGRTYFDEDGSWRMIIGRYLQSDRAFKHPRLQMVCLQKGMVTCRNLDFDLEFVK